MNNCKPTDGMLSLLTVSPLAMFGFSKGDFLVCDSSPLCWIGTGTPFRLKGGVDWTQTPARGAQTSAE
eukprot:5099100-Amphidinium_carterae.2